jgi:hypothetical protein
MDNKQEPLINIVDLYADSDLWLLYKTEQAHKIYKIEKTCYGDYQHDKVERMFGIGGDTTFQEIRNEWIDDVKDYAAELRAIESWEQSNKNNKIVSNEWKLQNY